MFENLKAALAAVGAGFKDVVKINSYLADIAHLPILREMRDRLSQCRRAARFDHPRGASFAREGALLEVEVVAVLPGRRGQSQRNGARRQTRDRAKPRSRRDEKESEQHEDRQQDQRTPRTCSRKSSAS